MSATEELRRMLDERGVEHFDGTETTLWGYEPTSESTGAYRFAADETSGGRMQARMFNVTPAKAIEATLGRRTCSTCYYYQTVYDRNRPTDRRACFGEHLRVSVGGLDWDEEAEAWADMAPGDCCSRWTAKKICRTIGANGEQVDACSQD